MHTKGYSNIPSELFYYITFLTRALPLRSAKTFIELLIINSIRVCNQCYLDSGHGQTMARLL